MTTYTMPDRYALFRQMSEELISCGERAGLDSVNAFVDIHMNHADGLVYPSIRVIGQYDQNDLIIEGEGYEETLQSLEIDTMPAIPELGETEDTVSTILETTFLLTESGFASVQLKGHKAQARISWLQTSTGFLLFDLEGHGLEVNHESGVIQEIIDPNLSRQLLDNKERIKLVKYAKSDVERIALLEDIHRTHEELVKSIPVH